MQNTALPAGWRRLALADLPRERWRNGAGWTRTIDSASQGEHIVWRVSLAEINRSAPFSLFPGMDRTAVLLQGGPLTLRSPQQHWTLQVPGDQARFPGEWALSNTAPETDALIWNLMVRRGQAAAELVVQHRAPVELPDDGDSFTWVMRGRYRLVAPDGADRGSLDEGEGLHSRKTQDVQGCWTLNPASPDACLLRTHIL
ncbi:MAG: HutD family protein [Burkholderiales bacterium]